MIKLSENTSGGKPTFPTVKPVECGVVEAQHIKGIHLTQIKSSEKSSGGKPDCEPEEAACYLLIGVYRIGGARREL